MSKGQICDLPVESIQIEMMARRLYDGTTTGGPGASRLGVLTQVNVKASS